MNHCFIGKLNKNGSVTSIYCFYGVDAWKVLNEHYSTEERVEELLQLGDIVSVSKKLYGSKDHNILNPEKDVTVAYTRDRGDEDRSAHTYKNLEELMFYARKCSFKTIYIYTNKWEAFKVD